MAFRRFNALNEDLSISDSDEDDIFQMPVSKDVDKLLAGSDEDSDDSESINRVTTRAPTSSVKQGAMSNIKNGSSQHSSVQQRERHVAATASSSRPSNMTVGEPRNGPNFTLDRRGTTQKLVSTSIRTRSRGLVSYEDVEDVDLEEVIRKRNIQAPPRAPRHHNDRHNDRPITGTRKMLNINPEEMSLDEIIHGNKCFQQIPIVGRGGYVGRGRGTFHHRRQYPPHHHQNSQGGEAEKTQVKLQRGLETIVESHGEANVLDNVQLHEKSSEFLKSTPDPWLSIKYLNEHGYGTYCVLMKLKQEEHIGEELAERMFKCIITYNDISGVCEAAFSYQAKQGAAVDFLKKLCAQFPKIGPMPTKLSDEVLMNSSALTKLKSKLKELRKVEYTTSFHLTSSVSDNHGRVSYKCILNIDPYKYEGSCYQNFTLAKLNAVKRAYEDLIKEPFPFDRIYVGEHECTTDSSLYRDVVSRKVHCYDLTRTTVYKPGTLQKHLRGNGHRSGSRGRGRNGNVMVSVVEPKGCD